MSARRGGVQQEDDFRGFTVEEALDNAALTVSRVEDSAGALVRKWVADGGAQVGGALRATRLQGAGGIGIGAGQGASGPLAALDPARGAREAAQWVESRVEALARSIADTRAGVAAAAAGGGGGGGAAGAAGGAGASRAPLGRGRGLGAVLAAGARGSAAAAQLLRAAAAAPLLAPKPAGVVAEPRARRPPRGRESGAHAHADAEEADEDVVAAWQQQQQQQRQRRGAADDDTPTVAVDLPEVAVRDGQLFLEGERVDDVRQKARRVTACNGVNAHALRCLRVTRTRRATRPRAVCQRAGRV
jgi:hypothetical protein